MIVEGWVGGYFNVQSDNVPLQLEGGWVCTLMSNNVTLPVMFHYSLRVGGLAH